MTRSTDWEKGRLLTFSPKREPGRIFFKVGLTSMREELCVDLLECFFIDHTAGALLQEGDRVSGVSEGPPREQETGPSLGV